MKDPHNTASHKKLIRDALEKLEDLERRLARAESFRDAPTAAVGMACRFPGGADTLERYWDNIQSGRECVTEVPGSRFDVDPWFDPDPAAIGKSYCRHGGFLDGVDRFDAGFFGISPRDA